jgi:predicted RNA binding protein YcfA (HicA-like mRNA interferase family)
MKIPRDLSAEQLIKLLKKYGYSASRQTGSHIRLTSQIKGEHHLTIPNHSPLKLGTLSAIVSEVATYLGKAKNELMDELFE